MSFLIVHLSDFHFKSSTDSVADRALAVKQAILAKVPAPNACFLVLSGDIANTGDSEEYEGAARFIKGLTSGLIDSGLSNVYVVAVPGNHDLNLRTENDTRQLVLAAPEAYLSKPINFDGANYTSIVAVQDDFFRLESSISGQHFRSGKERLHYQREFTVGDTSFVFHCFNTAWLSRRNEIQAKLFIPADVLTGSTPSEAALSIAVFHHPYIWMNADNQRLLKAFVEKNTDVVLTGHEHEGDLERHVSIKGIGLDYLRAPAFNDPEVPKNGFQVLVVNFQNQTQDVSVFEWTGTRFTETETACWALHRNAGRPSNPFALRAEFLKELRDMGTGFQHPRCVPPQCELKLRDLYVYPDLMHERLDRTRENNETIYSVSLPSFLRNNPKLLVYGTDDCGKTSLARILYEDLTDKGFLPVLLRGDQLKGTSRDSALVKVLSGAIVEQYETRSAEPYLQTDNLRKAVIIDGFEKAKLTREGQINLLNLMQQRFGTIVIFASDILRFQDIASTAQGNPFHGYEKCTIREFGRYHRLRLIRAWLSIGRETSDEAEDISKRVLETDKTISTLLGKNVLPHFPVTILTLLQILESKETANTANGAYGYMYEVLLKSALARVNPKDVDEKITYISGIGYYMFHAKQPVLTEEELRQVHDEYCVRYDMVRDFSKVIADLLKAEVLVESRGSFRFKYPYEYYYSTAKYFQDHSSTSRAELFSVADHIYGEANANVLIFYVYLTKDEELINHLIEGAKQVYAGFKPCDIENDVEFINKLAKMKPPPLILEYGGASDHRDEHNRKQDAAEAEAGVLIQDDLDVVYNDQLHEIVKISIALKTLQVLGQVLRNFTGSLEGPLKFSITKECYALGLRMLAAVLSIPSKDLEGIRQYLGGLIAERTGITDKEELATKTDDAIVWLGVAWSVGTVKRITYAVGHGDLTKTYMKILKESNSLPNQVIDVAIKLEHFPRIPERELNGLESRVKDNYFAYNLVRDLVADHLYLNDIEFPVMQKLGAKWDILVSEPKFLDNRSKK
jgi:predicted MPP superfamily phosphohydrolase